MKYTQKAANSEQEMNRYWSHRSESYSDMNRSQFRDERRLSWERAIFDGIDESRRLKILDIGTGPGFFAILCALRGHDVTAVDMNADMLDHAQKNAAAAGAHVQFLQVGHILPFPPESFDLIICRDVTWTLTDPEVQMKAWAALLRPDGVLRYFDAEWYYYLKTPEARAKRLQENAGNSSGHWYARAHELEQIAEGLPMTYRSRPAWDREFWRHAGYACTVEENLNARVYDRQEQLRYQEFPEFCVTVGRK